jgi:hypothetical protein
VALREWFSAAQREDSMIKQVLAGVAAFGLMSGVAFADQYPPPPPSMPLAPPSVGTSPGEVNPPGIAPGPEITKKYIHREGSSKSPKTTVTDPAGGTTTTRSKRTAKQE